MVIFTVIDGGLSGVARGSTYEDITPMLGGLLGTVFNDISSVLGEGISMTPLLEGGDSDSSITLAWLRMVISDKLDNNQISLSRISITELTKDVNSEIANNGLSMLAFSRKEVYDVLVSLTGRTIFAY